MTKKEMITSLDYISLKMAQTMKIVACAHSDSTESSSNDSYTKYLEDIFDALEAVDTKIAMHYKRVAMPEMEIVTPVIIEEACRCYGDHPTPNSNCSVCGGTGKVGFGTWANIDKLQA